MSLDPPPSVEYSLMGVDDDIGRIATALERIATALEGKSVETPSSLRPNTEGICGCTHCNFEVHHPLCDFWFDMGNDLHAHCTLPRWHEGDHGAGAACPVGAKS